MTINDAVFIVMMASVIALAVIPWIVNRTEKSGPMTIKPIQPPPTPPDKPNILSYSKPKMKYLNLDLVKMNLRIEVLTTSSEKQREIDNRIAKMCAIAEGSVLEQLDRTTDDLMAEYGEIPQTIKAVTLMVASGLLEHCPPNPDVVKILLTPKNKKKMK